MAAIRKVMDRLRVMFGPFWMGSGERVHSDGCLSTGGVPSAGECLDVVGGEGLAVEAPRAAGDLLDQAPRDRSHPFALDRDHRVGEALDDFLLLRRRVDARHELDLDERHAVLPWGL